MIASSVNEDAKKKKQVESKHSGWF